jgi:hypothetical protein
MNEDDNLSALRWSLKRKDSCVRISNLKHVNSLRANSEPLLGCRGLPGLLEAWKVQRRAAYKVALDIEEAAAICALPRISAQASAVVAVLICPQRPVVPEWAQIF